MDENYQAYRRALLSCTDDFNITDLSVIKQSEKTWLSTEELEDEFRSI